MGGSGGEDTDSDFGDDDAPASFQHISLCQPVVPRANALLAGAAASRSSVVPEPRVLVTQPTGEFTGSIVTLDRVATEAERVAECEEAIRRMKQEDLAAQQHGAFCGGFTVEPAADQDGGGQLAVQDVFGEIGCEPCERGPEPALPPEVYEGVLSALRAGGAVPAGGAAGAGGAAAAGGAAGAGDAYAAGGAAAGGAAEYDEYEDYDDELEFSEPADGVTADYEI
ncbi:hypothetical protein CYMTET_50392 [Cymbomonas tetramitiformis]|uniref:Uncharacterized protein n=1 Tax=Cymbomonas tetramitiformis TaxID=36881 RepID=A0AAE0ETI9_9CHLO|nr:hypothetical protein CYMTET_50392 [Cymbomonas tetramitiformis]